METNVKLTEPNRIYLDKIKNRQKTVQNPIVQEQKDDNNKKDKLVKALVCLGAIGATAIVGAMAYRAHFSKFSDIEFDKGLARLKGQADGFSGTIKDKLKNGDKVTLTYSDGIIQSSKRKGKVNFTKTYRTINGERIVKKRANGITEEINIAQLPKNVKILESNNPIKLPKYLYHVTSGTSMEKISQSDLLKVSRTEQLPGVYLLDSENFLSHYGKTRTPRKNRDLISAIFRQASRSDKNMPLNDREFAIIRIPTEDLLRTGKIRIRTQEDFFYFQGKINKINAKLKTNYKLRQLYDDKTRAQFVEDVVSNGIMKKEEMDNFIKEMTKKIHHGYHLGSVPTLSDTKSVEYIFNHDIQLSTMPNIRVRRVRAQDYVLSGSNGFKYDANKVPEIFNPNLFVPYKKS